MTTIVLLVSRAEYLEKVISRIEMLECNHIEVNFLCIVDGNELLYVHTRNLVNDTKFNERLTVRLDYPGSTTRLDIPSRRRRIAAAHNQAKDLIQHTNGYIFSVEDDTLIGVSSLNKLMKVAINHPAFAMVEGVELGRWGVPYVGAWKVDNIYEPETITSIENKYTITEDLPEENIDAGGLYCALIRADLYKQHTFTSENGLGPDVNFGLELRQLGYENFIVWTVPCTHLTNVLGKEMSITPTEESKIVTLTKVDDTKWRTSY